MNSNEPDHEIPVLKDESSEHPVPSAWRPIFKSIVSRFVAGDYGLRQGVQAVEPVSEKTEDHIRSYIDDYGETLIELPDDTWSSSVSLWMNGYWEVLVDLWTAGEGRSDLVLHARVSEREEGKYSFQVEMVYVP